MWIKWMDVRVNRVQPRSHCRMAIVNQIRPKNKLQKCLPPICIPCVAPSPWNWNAVMTVTLIHWPMSLRQHHHHHVATRNEIERHRPCTNTNKVSHEQIDPGERNPLNPNTLIRGPIVPLHIVTIARRISSPNRVPRPSTITLVSICPATIRPPNRRSAPIHVRERQPTPVPMAVAAKVKYVERQHRNQRNVAVNRDCHSREAWKHRPNERRVQSETHRRV